MDNVTLSIVITLSIAIGVTVYRRIVENDEESSQDVWRCRRRWGTRVRRRFVCCGANSREAIRRYRAIRT